MCARHVLYLTAQLRVRCALPYLFFNRHDYRYVYLTIKFPFIIQYLIMRPKLLLPLLFAVSFSFAQQPLTTVQINRLVDAGKIYGYIKYFHPFLQYKDINWDSTFAANVETIIKAENKIEYAAVLEKIFSVLNDGLTTVAKIPGDDSNYKVQSLAYQIEDSILYLQMNDAPFLTTDEALSKALQNMGSVKGAIFDLRRPKNSKYMGMLGNGMYWYWLSSWYKGKILMPSVRTISYSGFPGEFCKGCNNAIFKEQVLFTAAGDLDKDVPLVIITANDNDIPPLGVKLQEKGVAKILQEGDKELLPGSSIYFYIADSLLIQMRNGEAINSDGSLLLVHSDATFKREDNSNEIMAKAKKLLLSSSPRISENKEIHPMATDPLFPTLDESVYPTIGYRMLAAAKMFTVIDHFYASKGGMTKNWEAAYREAILNFIGASDSLEYWKAVAEFHAHIQDSHGFISKSDEGFSLRLNPMILDRGAFMPPVFTGIIENKIVVTGIFNDSVCKKIGINKGDIILSIDGKDPMPMIEKVRKYQNAGNIGSQNFYLGSFILFGNKGQVKKLKIQDTKGRLKEIMMTTQDEFKGNWLADKYVSGMFSYNHQPVLKYLAGDIIYADQTSGLKNSDIDSVSKWINKAKGFIVDMRGYPQGARFPLELMFPDKIRNITPEISYKKTANIPASSPNVISVNRFGSRIPAEQYQTEYLTKDKTFDTPVKFVVLTNGSAQSNGDYFPFIFRSLYNATIIGSPTAGAMSNFTNYTIPGNIRLWLSFYGIKREGIQPDIFIRPTIKGIQAGKDEVLERAIKYLQTGK